MPGSQAPCQGAVVKAVKAGPGGQDLVAAGRKIGADLLITGTVQKFANRIRAMVQFVGVRDRAVRWAGIFDEVFTSFFDAQDSISERITLALEPHLAGKESGPRDASRHEAYQCYLKGRYFWNQRTEEAFRKSIRYFEQAIEIDPQYALAYVGLADCYCLLAYYTQVSPRKTYPKAVAAVRKALELDESLAEAHASLAMAEVDYQWRWAVAESRYRRALSLNPNYAMAHDWFAEYLTAMGRHQEAMTQIHQALELDPYSLTINRDFGFLLYMARRYEQAIEQLQSAIEMDPNSSVAHCFLAGALEQAGRFDVALGRVREASSRLPESVALLTELAYAHAVSGNRKEAVRLLRQLEESARSRYVSPYDIATVHIALQDSDQAFHWLEQACEVRPWRLVYLKVEPRLDPLRGDPRFAAIATRLGLRR